MLNKLLVLSFLNLIILNIFLHDLFTDFIITPPLMRHELFKKLNTALYPINFLNAHSQANYFVTASTKSVHCLDKECAAHDNGSIIVSSFACYSLLKCTIQFHRQHTFIN